MEFFKFQISDIYDDLNDTFHLTCEENDSEE